MALRPTKAHFLRMSAQKTGADVENLADFSEYEKMLHLLSRHKKELKSIQSMSKRAEYKKVYLPNYLPWIEGVLSEGNGKQDDVLMTWLVWSIDCGENELALNIADYAIHQDLVLPEGFTRTVPTLLAEEFADQAKAQAKLTDIKFDVDVLLRVEKLTQHSDMPDESRARLYREIGFLLAESEPQQALTYLENAYKLDQKSGVVGEMNKLKKQLGKQTDDTKTEV